MPAAAAVVSWPDLSNSPLVIAGGGGGGGFAGGGLTGGDGGNGNSDGQPGTSPGAAVQAAAVGALAHLEMVGLPPLPVVQAVAASLGMALTQLPMSPAVSRFSMEPRAEVDRPAPTVASVVAAVAMARAAAAAAVIAAAAVVQTPGAVAADRLIQAPIRCLRPTPMPGMGSSRSAWLLRQYQNPPPSPCWASGWLAWAWFVGGDRRSSRNG